MRAHLAWWSAAWISAVLTSVVVLSLQWPELNLRLAAAFIIVAAPASLGLLSRRSSQGSRVVLLVAWTVAGGAACILGGGVGGPLSPWCLAPVAGVAVFGRRRLIAQAGALSVVSAAVASLVQLAGLLPPAPVEGLQIWMGLVALFTTAGGLSFGAILALHRLRDLRRPAVAPVLDTAALSLLDAQPYLMLLLGRDGTVLAAHGESPQGLVLPALGARVHDLATLATRPALMAALRGALEGGRQTADFAPLGEADRTCSAILKPMGADGSGVLAVIRDSSKEHWREAELEASKAEAEALNAGKSRFLANMSHELRTPLNAVIGFSDVMRARLFGELTPKYGEYVEMIHESGRHLLDLINDVLDMSKIEADRYPLSKESFDVREVVNGALRLVRVQADNAGVSLRGLIPPQPLDVDADRRALKQIVLNLVSNALKFTPGGGTVTVSVRAEAGMLEIVVSDTGVGIAREDLQRLGRPFEQAGDSAHRAQGTGLGLSLVRAFAELHGGTMAIDSTLGEGTQVAVRLPVLLAQAGDEPPQVQSARIIPFGR